MSDVPSAGFVVELRRRRAWVDLSVLGRELARRGFDGDAAAGRDRIEDVIESSRGRRIHRRVEHEAFRHELRVGDRPRRIVLEEPHARSPDIRGVEQAGLSGGLRRGDRRGKARFGKREHALLIDGRPEVERRLTHRHAERRVRKSGVQIRLGDERLTVGDLRVGPRVELRDRLVRFPARGRHRRVDAFRRRAAAGAVAPRRESVVAAIELPVRRRDRRVLKLVGGQPFRGDEAAESAFEISNDAVHHQRCVGRVVEHRCRNAVRRLHRQQAVRVARRLPSEGRGTTAAARFNVEFIVCDRM